ncbi:hypothetical protein R1flu_004258 [Riccia fluitans]|uniref:Cilia- and flagella-associated protein 157 n=1 Tax=Riccia fluitans TaxID=41844 RepID=A0ABD1YPS5_9MARC
MASKDGKKGKLDDATMYKTLYIQKGLEVVVMEDKCKKLEARSMHMEEVFEQMTQNTDGKIANLEEIVSYLNCEEAKKVEKIANLEAQVAKLETELKETTERLNKELEDTRAKHEFEYNTLKLQMESANVKLREMHDFSLRKAAMEAELISLKEQLSKEQRDHAEAISDVERNAVQERERLKKEIERRVEETKQQMTRLMEEQLHQMEDDLSFRNHLYQKTTRILVYKLRELEKEMEEVTTTATIKEEDEGVKKRQEQELQALLNLSAEPAPKITLTSTQEALSPAAKTGEEAMRFLYACLEDLELERVIEAKEEHDKIDPNHPLGARGEKFALSTTGVTPPGATLIPLPTPPQVVKSLDNLTLQERHDMLKGGGSDHFLELYIMRKLLRAAASLRTVTDSMVGDALDCSKYAQSHPAKAVGKSNIRVDDILGIPLDALALDGPARPYQWKKPTTAGVQANLTSHAVRMRSPTLFV